MIDVDINKLTEKIIGCAFEVSNSLGIGFVEKVYENAYAHLLRKNVAALFNNTRLKLYLTGLLLENSMRIYLSMI